MRKIAEMLVQPGFQKICKKITEIPTGHRFQGFLSLLPNNSIVLILQAFLKPVLFPGCRLEPSDCAPVSLRLSELSSEISILNIVENFLKKLNEKIRVSPKKMKSNFQ